MINDVTVTIDVQKVTGTAGMGFPLIIYKEPTPSEGEATASPYTELKTQNFSSEVTALKDFVDIMLGGSNPPDKIATMSYTGTVTADSLKTLLEGVETKGWRQVVIIDYKGATDYGTLLDYIKGTKKVIYVPKTLIPSNYEVAQNKRVIAVAGESLTGTDDKPFETAIDNIADIFGATCGLAAGSFTYKNIIVNGGHVMDNDEYATAVKASNAYPFIAVLEKAGDNVTSDGQAISGDYIDVVDSEDYIVNQIEYQLQKLLNVQNKIPYTNNGIAMLESAVLNVLVGAYNNGMIADNEDGSPAYDVSFAMREDAEAEDIQARRYIGGKFEFVLSGAIHTVKVNGTIKYV